MFTESSLSPENEKWDSQILSSVGKFRGPETIVGMSERARAGSLTPLVLKLCRYVNDMMTIPDYN